jgi:hypothetical protein
MNTRAGLLALILALVATALAATFVWQLTAKSP